MGISGEVAGKPGGGELAELLRKLESSDPAAISAVARRWRAAGDSTGNAAGQVRTAVTGLDGAWQGASADAFVGYMGRVHGGFDAAKQAVVDSATALDRAAEAVRGAKEALTAIGERALADAKRFEGIYDRAAAQHQGDQQALEMAARVRDDNIRQAMQQHAADARGKVDTANQALNDALSQLKNASDGMAEVFSRIPQPGEQNFTPAPGRRVDWRLQDPGAPAGTAPAGAPAPGGTGPGTASAGGDSAGGSAGSGGASYAGSSGSDGSGSSGSAGGSGGLGPSGGPPAGGPPPGNVDQWIREAIRILREHGVPVTEDNIDEIWQIIQKESGGDPHAINNWDSNAAKGTPSKGLMQCIDPTFQSYKLPGHDDIYDPVDNIIAGVRYTFDRYGGFENHPGLKSMASGGGYQGY